MGQVLPLRFRLLHYMSTVKEADVDDMMEALRPEYGKETQFTRMKFVDHALSMKANFIIDEVRITVNDRDELDIYYSINDEGKKLLTHYLPKAWKNAQADVS